MTRLVVIAGVARGGAIGRDNALPWRLPEDLRRFRSVTLGHPVIMGRRTWESLPASVRPLPGRRNIVVTRDPGWRAAGAERAASLDDALALAAAADNAFVIGGAELYAAALPRADALLLTEIDADIAGADAFFPPWPRERFDEVMRELRSDGPWRYAFVEYRRRAP